MKCNLLSDHSFMNICVKEYTIEFVLNFFCNRNNILINQTNINNKKLYMFMHRFAMLLSMLL